ncbi:SRPBCC family protein [Actinopolymorpha sp. B17G11]|uniref:SRPBCC family protein n=1 Tax=unclassified Actinopolymorpha TaxID=2627063 RepID=UPI0032D8C309
MSDDVQASIEMAADPRAVYDIVTDVAQLPRWAAETVSCRWLDGADGPVVGARFRGVNRHGPLRWWTTSTVTEARPGRCFAWKVTALRWPIAEWRYEIEPADGGCRVTERTRNLTNPFFRRIVGPLGTGVANRAEHNRRNMEKTLLALKEYVAASP